jgi:hypothetical protein
MSGETCYQLSSHEDDADCRRQSNRCQPTGRLYPPPPPPDDEMNRRNVRSRGHLLDACHSSSRRPPPAAQPLTTRRRVDPLADVRNQRPPATTPPRPRAARLATEAVRRCNPLPLAPSRPDSEPPAAHQLSISFDHGRAKTVNVKKVYSITTVRRLGRTRFAGWFGSVNPPGCRIHQVSNRVYIYIYS